MTDHAAAAPARAAKIDSDRIAVVDRRLEGGRPHVTVEHTRVGVVEDRRLHSAA